MRKALILLCALLLLIPAIGSPAIAQEKEADKDLSGYKMRKPLPASAQITVADAVSMLVKGFKLDAGGQEMPEAEDLFTKVPNDAKYADDFVIAHLNGLPLDRDVDPEAKITKEEYANLLYHALMTTGEYVFILIYMEIADGDQIDEQYMAGIQNLLVSKIIELDKENKFHPKDPVKAGEARIMLHRALRFAEEYAAPPQDEKPPVNAEVSMSVEAVNEKVNKVTLSWGTKPNPGYGISVRKIEFEENRAIIYYELHYPDPDMMYPQVIVEPKATVYIDSQYKPEIREISVGEIRMPNK